MNNNIYKNILKKSPFGFAYHKVVMDKDGEVIDYIFLETNSAFEELTGLKNSNIINKKITEIIPKIKESEEFDWIKFYGEVAINGVEKDFEQYSITLDKWYKVQAFSFEKYYFATVFLDFTHNKESEIQIFNQKQQFELAVNGSRDGIWDWNLLTNEVYFSPRWKEQLGYEDNEIENSYSNFQSLIHPDDLEMVARKINSYLKGNLKVYDLEFRMRHKDGSYRWINARGKALNDSKGVPYRMAGSHTDITEKKKLEEKILEEKENQKTILNGLPGIYIQLFDKNMNVIFYNDEIKKRYNISPENENKPCYEYILNRKEPCKNCTARRAIKTKKVQENEAKDLDGNILGDFRTREFRWWRNALGKHFANFGAGKENEVFFGVIGGIAHHDDFIEFFRPSGVIRFEDFNIESARRNLILEDRLSVKRTIVIADTRMVASNDQVSAAGVLTEKRHVERLHAVPHTACRNHIR